MAVIKPDLRFSGLYFPEILQDLLVWKRVNVPELSDEDPHEPYIQLLAAFALVGHNHGVLADFIAQEALLPSARLRESVRGHLRLIGVELLEATPAVAPLIITLPSFIAAPITLPKYMRVSTTATEGSTDVPFETTAEMILSQSDLLTQAWELDGGVWTDRTAALNALGAPFTPWGGAAVAGDMLYLGHDSVLWDRLSFVVGTWQVMVVPTDIKQSWEYYDGQLNDTTPNSVTNTGAALRFNVNALLGSIDRHGATVRVRCLTTGAYQDLTSTWDGGSGENRIGTGAGDPFLGQAVPSTTTTDYIIGTLWKELPGIVWQMTSTTGTIDFTLPETLTRRWQKTTVNGVKSYWIRCRMVAAGPLAPFVLDTVTIHEGKQYLSVEVTQGLFHSDVPVGQSSGLSNQTVVGTVPSAIQGTVEVYVDEGSGYDEWTIKANLLSSKATDNDCVVTFDADGVPLARFGDGTNGRIPPAGANIRLDYRYGADEDGDVGAGTITSNKSGSAYIASVTNPRAAAGWQAAEGSTEDDLARVKIAGPASLRALNRALTADDIETVCRAFVASDGSSPVARAFGKEEALGPKTVKAILVGAGGAAINSEFLDELDEYLNGDPVEGTSGVLVLNSQATVVNYDQKPITVVATVQGSSSVNALAIQQALIVLLSPLALEEDSTTWVYSPGGKVYQSRMISACFAADSGVDNVVSLTLNGGGDVTLGADELPVPATVTVNVV